MKNVKKLMLVGILGLLAVGCSSTKKEEVKPAEPEVVETVVIKPTIVEEVVESIEDEIKPSLVSGYAVDQYVLDDNQISQIVEAAAYIAGKYPDAKLEVVGHTDNTGSYDYNMALGLRRAEAVKKELAKYLSNVTIDTLSEGYNKNVASNDTAEGRAENRRVDINIIK